MENTMSAKDLTLGMKIYSSEFALKSHVICQLFVLPDNRISIYAGMNRPDTTGHPWNQTVDPEFTFRIISDES